MVQKVTGQADFDQIITQINRLTAEWIRNLNAMHSVGGAAKILKEDLKKLTVTTKLQVDEATQVEITAKTVDGAFKVVSASIQDNTVKLEANRKKLAQVAAEQQRLAAIGKASAGTVGGLTTRLGPVPTGTTGAEQLSFRTAEASVKDFVKKNAIGAEKVREIWTKVASGAFGRYEGRLQRLQTLIFNLQQAHARMGATAVAAQQKVARQQVATNARVQQGKKRVDEMTISWRTIGRLIEIQALHRLVSFFVQAVREGVVASIELSKSIAEVQTISQIAPGFTESQTEWLRVARAQSEAFGLTLEQEIEGAYQSLSNQVIQTADEFIRFGRVTDAFAITARATADEAVNLLTASLNAFGEGIEEAENHAATFFKTIELGRVRANEMANAIGRIAVPAAQLNIELEELDALIALGTIRGIKYNEVATQIRGVLVKLIKPTKEMKAVFRELGVATGEEAIQTFGLAGFLQLLDERTRGSSEEIGKLIPRIRGMNLALLLSGKGLQDYNEILAEIKDSTESYGRATAIVQESVGKRLELLTNKIRNFFKIDVGLALVESVDNITKGFKGIETTIRAFTFFVTSALVPVIGALLLQFGKLINLARKNPFGQLIIGGTLLITFFRKLNNQAKDFNRFLSVSSQLQRDQLAELLGEQDKALNDSIKGLESIFEKRRGIFIRDSAIINRIISKSIEDTQRGYQNLLETVEETITTITESIETSIDDQKDAIKDLTRDIKQLETALAQGGPDLDKTLFDWELEKRNAGEQFDLIDRRIAELDKERQKALDSGDVQLLSTVDQRILELKKQQRQIALDTERLDKQLVHPELGFRSRIPTLRGIRPSAQIEEETHLVLVQQQRDREALIGQLESQRFIARQILGLEEQLQDRIKTIGDRLDDEIDFEDVFDADQPLQDAIQAVHDLEDSLARLTDRPLRNLTFGKLEEARENVAERERELTGKAFEGRRKELQQLLRELNESGGDRLRRAREAAALLTDPKAREEAEEQIANIAISVARARLVLEQQIAAVKKESLKEEALALNIQIRNKGRDQLEELTIQKRIVAEGFSEDQERFRRLSTGFIDVSEKIQRLFPVGLGVGFPTGEGVRVRQVKPNILNVSGLQELFGGALGVLGVGPPDLERDRTVTDALNRLQGILPRVVEEPETIDVEQLLQIERDLATLVEQFVPRVEIPLDDRAITEGLRATVEGLLKDVRSAINENLDLTDLTNRIDERRIEVVDISQQLVDTVLEFGTAEDRLVLALDELGDEFANLAKDIVTALKATKINTPPEVEAATGGLIGGIRGAGDVVKALLSPGEFVVNPRSTTKFAAQLFAINQGLQPAGVDFNAGGTFNFGDINIDARDSNGDPETIGRAVWSHISRGLKRGTYSR